MPRIALGCLLVAGGCAFSGNYDGARLTCSDRICPAGLECREDINPPMGECRELRMDGGIDTPVDMMMMDADAAPSALICSDPGLLSSGVNVSGTTAARVNKMSSLCSGGGGVQNGPDAVYRITTTQPNKQLRVEITGSLNAYVTNAPCTESPATQACLGSVVATAGNPATVAAASVGQYFVVVDTLSAGVSGPYTLTVTIQ
jgi:hypothetical protein